MIDFPWKGKHRQAQKEDRARDLAKRLVTTLTPDSIAPEAYRSLRTNLMYSFLDNPPKTVVITSAGPQEGESTTCANLGIVLAQANKNILMIDCDFRRPVLHKIFGVSNIHGMVDVLLGRYKLQEVWKVPQPLLKVIPVGPIPLNPTELLGSKRFSQFLISVREEYDYILIDAPPIGLVSDAAILATQADGVLLILDAQNTRKVALRRSVRSLEAVGANVLGTVMNNAKTSHQGYYYAYKY